MVIAVVSSKGGTGKSTITLNLASMLSSNNQSVLVIDADPQGSIAHWSKIRKQEGPSVLVHPSPVYKKKVKKSSKKFDIILFDSPPTFKKRVREVIKSADKLIIPVTPGLADLWSTERLVDIYLEEKEYQLGLDKFEAALDIDPDLEEAKTGKQICLENL